MSTDFIFFRIRFKSANIRQIRKNTTRRDFLIKKTLTLISVLKIEALEAMLIRYLLNKLHGLSRPIDPGSIIFFALPI
jgi:hypothetical protein